MLEFENEEIHDAARDLIIRPPQCLMNYSGSASAAYQLGVMELARKLTGETAIEADKKAIQTKSESIVWIDASQELPDAGMEVFVCFERNDCEDRDTCLAEFDDSEEDESPWIVDGGITHFGTVMYWAEKPWGPLRNERK